MTVLFIFSLSLLVGGFSGYATEKILLWNGIKLSPAVVPFIAVNPSPPHLHAFSVATRTSPWSRVDSSTLFAAQGTTLKVLGRGDTRAPSISSGFKWAYALKLLHIRDAVSILPMNDLVLVVDAYDTYSVAPLVAFEEAFGTAARRESGRQKLDSRPLEIIISAEAWCFPNESLALEFPRSDRDLPLPFPNSGVYIGRAGALHRLLTEGPPWDIASTDDQDWFARAYLASLRNLSLPRVVLDHDSALAFSMGPRRSLRNSLKWNVERKSWGDILTGNFPLIYHYNGDKEDLKRGLVPRFWFGEVCFVEHWRSCTWWAAVAPSVSLISGLSLFFIPLRRLRSLFPCFSGDQKYPSILRFFVQVQTLPRALLALPAITIVVMVALCPFCARPQSTVWETLEYALWPPSQLFMWDPEYASGRVVAAFVASFVDLQIQKFFSGRLETRALNYIFSFLSLCISTFLGKFLFLHAGGPAIDSSGCIFVSFFILTLFRLVVWMDKNPINTDNHLFGTNIERFGPIMIGDFLLYIFALKLYMARISLQGKRTLYSYSTAYINNFAPLRKNSAKLLLLTWSWIAPKPTSNFKRELSSLRRWILTAFFVGLFTFALNFETINNAAVNALARHEEYQRVHRLSDPALMWRPHTIRQTAVFFKDGYHSRSHEPSERSVLLASFKLQQLKSFSTRSSAQYGNESKITIIGQRSNPEASGGGPWIPYKLINWSFGPVRECPVTCQIFQTPAEFMTSYDVSGNPSAPPSALLAVEPYFRLSDDSQMPGTRTVPWTSTPIITQYVENLYQPGPSLVTDMAEAGGSSVLLTEIAHQVALHTTWYSTYELDSHIPYLYLNTVRAMRHWRSGLELKILRKKLALVDRIPAVAVFVSNCNARIIPDRAAYLRLLGLQYPVHHFGKCNRPEVIGGIDARGTVDMHDAFNIALTRINDTERYAGGLEDYEPLRPGHENWESDKIWILKRYRYVSAIENSVGLDYVTEKVYDGLAAGAVPLYLGASNVWDFLPSSDSIISLRDFPSPTAVAEYLKWLDGDAEIKLGEENHDSRQLRLESKHHMWRVHPPSLHFQNLQQLSDFTGSASYPCRLCGCVAGNFGC